MLTPSPKRSPAYHYITDVDTDAEEYAAIRCETGIRFGQSGLRIHRALHGIDRAPELRKDTVARRVRYAAPVVPYELIEDRAPFGQALERADLVSAHETAVAFDICCEDCDEASADCNRVRHVCTNGTDGEPMWAEGLPASSSEGQLQFSRYAMVPRPEPSGTPAMRIPS
jgi:hypothetical protein